jgi:hypothetical protein
MIVTAVNMNISEDYTSYIRSVVNDGKGDNLLYRIVPIDYLSPKRSDRVVRNSKL